MHDADDTEAGLRHNIYLGRGQNERRRNNMTIAMAFALVLATSGPAGAQDFEPSPLEGADVTVVPRAELDAALPARSACREPVEVLNEDGLRWGRVRAGTLDLEAFRRQVENADYDWSVARGRCGNARKDIEDSLLTRRVLDHDARRLDRLRRAMSADMF